MLPHMRADFEREEEEPFETMEKEIAKRQAHCHPDFADSDDYGNKPMPIVGNPAPQKSE